MESCKLIAKLSAALYPVQVESFRTTSVVSPIFLPVQVTLVKVAVPVLSPNQVASVTLAVPLLLPFQVPFSNTTVPSLLPFQAPSSTLTIPALLPSQVPSLRTTLTVPSPARTSASILEVASSRIAVTILSLVTSMPLLISKVPISLIVTLLLAKIVGAVADVRFNSFPSKLITTSFTVSTELPVVATLDFS